MKRPPRIVPAGRSEHDSRIEIVVFAGRSLDAKRARYQVLVAICLRSGCGLRILFEVPAGIWGKPHPLMSASESTSTFVWILRIRKSEWLRGSVERQPVNRDSVLWCKWRTRHDSNVWPSPSEGDALSS